MALAATETSVNTVCNKELQADEELVTPINDIPISTIDKTDVTIDEETIMMESSPEILLKHPLQNTWTLWYLENDRTKSWEELQNEITSFDTVEDFWSLCNHIKSASEIKVGSDYSLFKLGIRPMWEDNANKKGGRWVITLDRKQHYKDLDNMWLDVLLCLIGEGFENSAEICGAVLNVRSKFDKISVWTADGNNQNAIMEIGLKIKESLHLDSRRITMQYQLHKDTMIKSSGASVKYIYSI